MYTSKKVWGFCFGVFFVVVGVFFGLFFWFFFVFFCFLFFFFFEIAGKRVHWSQERSESIFGLFSLQDQGSKYRALKGQAGNVSQM